MRLTSTFWSSCFHLSRAGINRCVHHHTPACAVLRSEPRASGMLSKLSANWATSSSTKPGIFGGLQIELSFSRCFCGTWTLSLDLTSDYHSVSWGQTSFSTSWPPASVKQSLRIPSSCRSLLALGREMRDWLVYRGQDTRKFKVPYFPSITIPQSIMNLSRKIWRILAEITKISLGLGGLWFSLAKPSK